ncbi:O-antigen ligase family protein [Photobacterium swingsii]|uniref:O-antigen ligase family protein n=1 Tax=Photobacterium swingsii TaxID=680026 RepID=UPI004067B589
MLRFYPIFFALNIIPVFFLSQQNPDIARFFGIPYAYLSSMCFGVLTFLYVIFSGRRITVNKRELNIIILLALLIFYMALQYYIIDSSASAIVNILSIVFFILLFVSISSQFKYESYSNISKMVERCNVFFIIGMIAGCLKYLVGFSSDANFLMFFNRNATALIVLLFFSLYSFVNTTRKKYMLFSLIYFSFFVLLDSRAGIIGFFMVLSVMFFKFHLKNIILGIFVFFAIVITLSSGFGEHITKRLDRATESLHVLVSDDTISSGENDFRRVTLLYSGVDIIKNNYLIGTGLGTENYLKYFNTAKFQTVPGQPHNFYLSYSAQLGALGFLLFSMLIYSCFSIVFKYGNRAGKAFVLSLLFYLTFNEYILLPEVWIFSGLFVFLIYKRGSIERL